MKIIKTAGFQIMKEMENFFEKRTNRHIDLVKKYIDKIMKYDNKFSKLQERKENHDQSKFEQPEYIPYLYITWQYKCKDEGKNFVVSDKIQEAMSKATEHHVKNNRHHPEFHSTKKVDLINREDRDKPAKEIIDATKMTELDIAEMIADWLAMSEEKGTDPIEWADKNVNVRWKFSNKQKELIYELINANYNKKGNNGKN